MRLTKLTVVVVLTLSFATACTREGEKEDVTTKVTENIQEDSKPAQQIIMEEYIKNYDGYGKLFLYDITGDGFPELLEMYLPEDAWCVRVYDFSSDEPIQIGEFEAGQGENIYFCQDSGGNRFILSHFGSNHMAGVSYYLCEKTTVMEHALQNGILGETLNYNVKEDEFQYYNPAIYFDGDVKEGVGFCRKNPDGQIESEEILIQYMNEYMENCEILDVLVLPDYENENFLQAMADKAEHYNYIPEYHYEESNAEFQDVVICGKNYDRQLEILYLSPEDLDETFDSDIFNEFPNLKEVCFSEGSEKEEYDVKKIKVSDWCGQIYKMSIAPQYFELTGDLRQFSLLWDIGIYGNGEKIERIDFIAEFPNLKVAGLYIDNVTMDQLKYVGNLQNIEVVAYSGMKDFFGGMTAEQKEMVTEIMADKVFVYVK